MKLNLSNILFVTGLSLSLAACGESFQGKFTGTATLDSSDCLVAAEGTQYDAVVSIQVSGGDIELAMTDMKVKNTNTHDSTFNSIMKYATANGSVDNANFRARQTVQGEPQIGHESEEPGHYDINVDGSLAPARDHLVITAWTVRVTYPAYTGIPACTISISAPDLVIAN
jgi:hypothetical protein